MKILKNILLHLETMTLEEGGSLALEAGET